MLFWVYGHRMANVENKIKYNSRLQIKYGFYCNNFLKSLNAHWLLWRIVFRQIKKNGMRK